MGATSDDVVRQALAAFPGLAIFSVVVAFNLIGDTLRDALDPRTAGAVQGASI